MGYIAALFIGVSLGLIGGGGSILTVPVLVYLFGISPILATSYSLFVVGTTSLAGSVNSYRKGLVDVRTALLFGMSSVLTSFLIRKMVIAEIPEIVELGSFTFLFSSITMISFALLMLVAAFSMIRSPVVLQETSPSSRSPGLLLLYGIGIGLVTGFLGAGGGFLLIPVLVLLLKIPMKTAVGTSLLIIALNSTAGFIGDAGHFETDWTFLIQVSAIAIAGVLAGDLLSKRIQGEKLKKGFGYFVMLMGICIIIKELLS
ncbi:MAG: sulfite exporter TauE/SafE family protein [Chitinophagaceae bacterium]